MDVNSIWWFILCLNLFWIIGILVFLLILSGRKMKILKDDLRNLEKIHTKEKNIKK